MDDERIIPVNMPEGAGENLEVAIGNCSCALIDFCGGEDKMTFEQKTQLGLLERWCYVAICANRGWTGPLTDAGLFNMLNAAEVVREIDANLNNTLLIACIEYRAAREKGEV